MVVLDQFWGELEDIFKEFEPVFWRLVVAAWGKIKEEGTGNTEKTCQAQWPHLEAGQ